MFQRYGANSRSVQITCEEDVSKELLYDAVELVVILLPRCLDYPRCYNLISVAVQKLTKEVDALCLLKDQTVVRSSEHIFLPNYVISLRSLRNRSTWQRNNIIRKKYMLG